MNKKSNLVKITEILKELKAERVIGDEKKIISSKYPEGSQAILIDEEKFVVLNNEEDAQVISSEAQFNTIKDSTIKYNADFFLSTRVTDEPDIIDWTHNKGKLINEAYKEVSFLPKDIISTATFNSGDAKRALRMIIDNRTYSEYDFDDYSVSESQYYKGDEYDEIYRIRCVFYDITGNEIIESLLIKAYKISNVKGEEYSYEIINSDYLKDDIEGLEKKIADGSNPQLQSTYSKISNDDYDRITSNIEKGIKQYYDQRKDQFFRLTRVDIKAIYALRMKKIPIELKLILDNNIVSKMPTYYSMIDGDLNVFSCPRCHTLSNHKTEAMDFKIHVDHDYRNMEDLMFGSEMPIGCTHCMDKCDRCGRWHFSLEEYTNIISDGYQPITQRKFLKNYANKRYQSVDFCSCKENLTWIFDEMSLVKTNSNIPSSKEKIVDSFLKKECKLVFVNYLTGEQIASYKDFIDFLYESLIVYTKPFTKIHEDFLKNIDLEDKDQVKLEKIANLVDRYMNPIEDNDGLELKKLQLENIISQVIVDYKNALAQAFSIIEPLIKVTSSKNLVSCESCQADFYGVKNYDEEFYYNSTKKLCHCCDEAITQNLNMWDRLEDGLTYYKSKKAEKTIRVYDSSLGEEIFDDWMIRIKKEIIQNVKKNKVVIGD